MTNQSNEPTIKDITATHFTDLTSGWFRGKLFLEQPNNDVCINLCGSSPLDKLQNFISGIEKEGYSVYFPELLPESGRSLNFCPLLNSYGFSIDVACLWVRYGGQKVISNIPVQSIEQEADFPPSEIRLRTTFVKKPKFTFIKEENGLFVYDVTWETTSLFLNDIHGHFWSGIMPVAYIQELSNDYNFTKKSQIFLDRKLERVECDFMLTMYGYLYLATFNILFYNLKKVAIKTSMLQNVCKSLKVTTPETSQSETPEEQEYQLAKQKALKSLRDELTEKEWKRFLTKNSILVTGKSGNQYRIRSHGHTIVFTPQKVLKEICLHTQTDLPQDHLLNLKTLIEIDESILWTEGNISEYQNVELNFWKPMEGKNTIQRYIRMKQMLMDWFDSKDQLTALLGGTR